MANSSKIVPLPDFLIERGEIKKENILDLGKFSVAMLYLSPEAKIIEHPHNSDNEIYRLVLGSNCVCSVNGKLQTLKCGEKSICLKGERHSLENPSPISTIRVLSIKYSTDK